MILWIETTFPPKLEATSCIKEDFITIFSQAE